MTAVIGPIAVHYIKLFSEKKKKDTLSESIATSKTITEKLEEIKVDNNADRVWLIQFHNGGHFYPTGKSIQKFSIVYEVLNTGVIPCQNQFQNIPVSLFTNTINYLHKGEIIAISDTDLEDKKHEGFTSIVSGSHVKSTYLFPLYNIKSAFIGIVGIDYVNKKTELSEEKITDIALELSTIGGVINNYLAS
jgi:hypothetical protein